MINAKEIYLSKEELQLCEEFAIRSARNQQKIEFGQSDTKPRPLEEISRDNMIGKIAEVAFAKMMKENYGIDIAIDFNYYPRGQWDNQDAVINDWRIDIKATRKGGQWLLVEWNKLCFRQKDNNLSHAYLMFSVDWDRRKDQPTGRVSYEGAASLKKLRHDCPTTRVLHRNENIPKTRRPLQADNYGIHFNDLYTDLNGLISYLTNRKPPVALVENYRNPYTGETISRVLHA